MTEALLPAIPVRSPAQPWRARLPLPAVCQAWWAMRDPAGFFAARSGGAELFLVRLPGFAPIHVTGTAAGAREVLGAPAEVFRAIKGSPSDPVLGVNSMMVMDGERHQRQRRLILPCFGPGKAQVLNERFAAVTSAELATLPKDSTVSVQELMQSLALNIVIEVIFGVTDPLAKQRFVEVIKDFVECCTPSLLLIPALRRRAWRPWRRFLKAQSRLDACLLGQVQALRAAEGDVPFSLLHVLLTATDADGDHLTDDELRDELRTLLVAGHETTATSLTWAFYYMLADPRIHTALQAELAEAPEGAQAYSQLPYLGAVCSEALRIHSVSPFSIRALRAPLTVRGQRLEADQNVALSLMLLHSDPAVFPQPDEFRPERFLNHKFGAYEFLPFGSGHRRCIGATFAQAEMRVVIGTILRQARLTLISTDKPRLILRHINSGPDRPIWVRLGRKG